MENKDLKTMESMMNYIVANYFICMSRIYRNKLDKCNNNFKDDVSFVNSFNQILDSLYDRYSEFIKREYIFNINDKWWFALLSEEQYLEVKAKSLKSFFKEFSCEY